MSYGFLSFGVNPQTEFIPFLIPDLFQQQVSDAFSRGLFEKPQKPPQGVPSRIHEKPTASWFRFRLIPTHSLLAPSGHPAEAAHGRPVRGCEPGPVGHAGEWGSGGMCSRGSEKTRRLLHPNRAGGGGGLDAFANLKKGYPKAERKKPPIVAGEMVDKLN